MDREPLLISAFLVGVASALVAPALGGSHGWLAHVPHDLLLAVPGAMLLSMVVGIDDVRDLLRSAGVSLAGLLGGVVVLLVAGIA